MTRSNTGGDTVFVAGWLRVHRHSDETLWRAVVIVDSHEYRGVLQTIDSIDSIDNRQ